MTQPSQPQPTSTPMWDDDAIVDILRRRQHHTKLSNGWSVVTLIAAADLMRMVRDDLLAAIAERDTCIEKMAQLIGEYALNATGDGWRIATLESELATIRERLKDVPAVYDELDRCLYGKHEDDDEPNE